MANSSKYPNSIDTTNELPLATNNVTPVIAEQVNRLRNAIINIETELGVNPSGTYSTVRDRLDAQNGTVGSGAIQIQNDGAVVVNEATIIDFIGNITVTNPSSLKARIEVTGGQATQVQETKTVSTNGQTSFTLTSTPVDSTSVLMFVNGLKQTYSSDFLVSGTSVSYVGSTSLTTADIVEFYYLVDLGGISGGGSSTITLKEDATTVSSSVTTINFTGNVNLTNNGSGQVTVDIPSGGGGGSTAQMRVYVTSNITNTIDALPVSIIWNGTSTFITATNCSLASGNTQIQVSVAGTYLLQGQFHYEGDPGSGVPQGISITFLKNGVTELNSAFYTVANLLGIDGEKIYFSVNCIAELAANDTVEVTSTFIGAGAGTILRSGEKTSWFSVKLLN